MGETEAQLTAVTSELGDDRSDHGLGVSIRRNNSEVEYLDATGIEEHAPMDWTPLMAEQLLIDWGYEVVGEWEDIDHTGGDDPTWKATVVRFDLGVVDFGDAISVETSLERAAELLFAIECDEDCPECLYGEQ